MCSARYPMIANHSANGWTALHWAASKGDVECIRTLIDYGADVNARDVANRTPLRIAQEMGFAKSGKLFSNTVSPVQTILSALPVYTVKMLGGPAYALHLLDMKHKIEKASVAFIDSVINKKADINLRNQVRQGGSFILSTANM